MHITHLRAPGFHAHDIQVAFEPLTAVLGEPFSGKSAVAMACQIGMLGRVPALGKELGQTFKNSSGSELFISLSFSNGQTNTFSISKDAEGALKSTRAFDCQFPDVMIDPWAYLGLTSQKRLEYVMDRTSLARVYDAHDLQTIINDEMPQALQLRLKPAKPVQQMADILAILNARAKEAKAEIKRLTGVIDTYKTCKPQGKDYTQELQAAKDAERKAIEARAAHGKRDYEAEIERAKRDKRELDSLVQKFSDEILRLQKREDEMAKLSACPTCKVKGTAWFKSWRAENAKAMAKVDADRKTYQGASERNARDTAKLEREAQKPDKVYAKLCDAARECELRVLDLEDRMQEYRDWKRKADECEKAILDRQKREEEQAKLKTQLARLVAYQSDVVAKVFKHLLATANDFTRGLLASELVYNDELQELGRWGQNAQWVSLDVFSGVERMLAYVGLQVALAQESPAKIVILDDPYAGMPRSWKRKVVDRMRTLVKQQTVDQVLFIDYDAEAYATDIHKVCV